MPRYIEAGERAVRLHAGALAQSPAGYSTLLAALEDTLTPPASVLLTGDPAACADWQRALEERYRPATRVFNVAGVEGLPPALVKGATEARSAAWVCRGTQCLLPLHALAAIERALDGDR